jgi:hypothetical protein
MLPNPFQPLFVGPNRVFDEPTSVYNNATISRSQLRKPFPQFSYFMGLPEARGSSTYHALQLRFEKRYSAGFNVLANYTWSKLIDDVSFGTNSYLGGVGGYQDYWNLSLEKSISSADTPHRLVLGYGYELPVGKGRAIGRSMNRAVDAVVGGWQLSGFVTFQSGRPVPIRLSGGRLADGTQRPHLIGDPEGGSIQDTVDNRAIRWNPAAFSKPLEQMAGTAPRMIGSMRGSGICNLDLSVFKTIRVTEQQNIQLRAEFFNFTNSPRFGDPNASVGSGSFGRISNQTNLPRQVQIALRYAF